MIKAIIFDFDGVLVQSEHINIEAARQAFKQHGYEMTASDAEIVVGHNPKHYVPVIIRRHGLQLEPTPIVEAEFRIYEELWPEMVEIMKPMDTVLYELKKRGVILALATTNSKNIVDRFMKKFGLEKIFSATVTQDEVSKLKPDPEVYQKAVDKLRIPKEEIFAVEDTSVGLAAAKNAGLRCAVIPNQYTQYHDFSGADSVMKSAEELLTILGRF